MRGFAHKAILCFMMIFLLTGVTGCMNNKESVVDKMVSYMNEKYDDHFEYSAPFGGGPDATSTHIIVSSEKYPEAEIWVEYYTKDSNEIFADNYVSYKYEEQTRNALQNLLEDVFDSEIKLRYGVGSKGSVNDFTNNTSFKQCNLDGSEILNINSNGVTIFDECSFCFASIFLNNIIENKNINSVNCNWAGAETDIRYYERHGRIKRLLIYCKNIADKDQIKTFSGNTVQFSPQMKRQRYYSILKTFHDYCLPNSAFDETIEIQSFMRGNYADILD